MQFIVYVIMTLLLILPFAAITAKKNAQYSILDANLHRLEIVFPLADDIGVVQSVLQNNDIIVDIENLEQWRKRNELLTSAEMRLSEQKKAAEQRRESNVESLLDLWDSAGKSGGGNRTE